MAQSKPHLMTSSQLAYVDRPEVSETFADSLRRVNVEGMLAKLEFVANRLDDPDPQSPSRTGTAITACRVVMPLAAMIEMLGKLQAIVAQLRTAGVILPVSNPPTSGRAN
jgi:hypothetical protein